MVENQKYNLAVPHVLIVATVFIVALLIGHLSWEWALLVTAAAVIVLGYLGI